MVTHINDPMTTERIIRGMEVILVIVLGVMLARLVAYLVTPSPVQSDIAGASLMPVTTAPAQDFQISPALTGLFGSGTDIAAVETEQPIQPTSLNLTLKGILADQGTNNRVALIASSGQKEKVYRVGDKVEGADIIRIEARRVIIRRNGVTEALDLQVNRPGAQSAVGRTTGPARILSLGENDRVIPVNTFKQQLSNLPTLLQQAQAIPQMNNGEQTGFRIVSINPGSIFEQIGIRQDDVINAVNDMPVRNVADAMNVYRTLATTNSFRVGLVRNGRDVVLNLSVR